MRTTIKDIAQKTGLSPSTVSLALNGKNHRISKETVARVLQTAKEMNYRPNQMAVGLITQKTKTIGLIVPDICNTFFGWLAKGTEMQCQKRGYNVFLCNTNDSPEKDVNYMNVLLDRGVDGIIYSMSANADGTKATECWNLIEQSNTPVVLVDRYVDEFPAVSVLIDHELGGYLATKHLLELGHRRIGCITGPLSIQSSKQRLFGYIRALQEYNIYFDPDLMGEGDYHVNSGYLLSERLLDRKVTAVFCCNDSMAYGVYRRMVQKGMHLPKDLSLVGFDNTEFSEFLEAPLTTVNQPVFELGATAVKKLIEMIDTPEQKQENALFTPELIVRKSTHPLAQAVRSHTENSSANNLMGEPQ